MISYKRYLDLKQLYLNGQNNIELFLPNDIMFYTSSVRGGLEYIINKLNYEVKNVFLPIFVPEGIIRPFANSNINIIFYNLDDNLKIRLDKLKERINSIEDIDKSIFVAINFMGIETNIGDVKKICERYNLLLLEDCAQSLFSKNTDGNYLGVTGDISFFSLPKTLPVPNGAVFIVNNEKLKYLENIKYKKDVLGIISIFSHLLFLLLKKYELRASLVIFNKFLNIINKLLYYTYYESLKYSKKPQRISKITKKILKNINFEKVVSSRKKNLSYLSKSEFIKNNIRIEFQNEAVLTGYPIYLKNREQFFSFCKKRKIECLRYKRSWFYFNLVDKKKYMKEFNIYKNHILLPINEYNTIQDMEKLAEALNDFKDKK